MTYESYSGLVVYEFSINDKSHHQGAEYVRYSRKSSDNPIEVASRTYIRCSNELAEAIHRISGKPFQNSGAPKDRFLAAAEEMESVAASAPDSVYEDCMKQIKQIMEDEGYDVDPQGSLPQDRYLDLLEQSINLLSLPPVRGRPLAVHVEDLSPREIKSAMRRSIEKHGEGHSVSDPLSVPIKAFFRTTLNDMEESGFLSRRLNVVESVFERMFGYVQELIDEEANLRLCGVGRKLQTTKLWVWGH